MANWPRPARLGVELRVPAVAFVLITMAAVASQAQSLSCPAVTEPSFAGHTGDGSEYAFWVPDEWDGNVLILFAQGVEPPSEPPEIPSYDDDNFGFYRDCWVEKGYAVATSDQGENGWAMENAVQRTHQLKALFASRVGRPRYTFLVGHSLGGLAIVKMAEKYGSQYSGVMPICAVHGGALAQITYTADARLLFDYFFPGVLPGTALEVPELTAEEITAFSEYAAYAALQGLMSPTQPTAQWLKTSGVPWVPGIPETPFTIAKSAATIAYFSLTYTNDFLARVGWRVPFDNIETVYSGSANDAALNATIPRFSSDPAAINFFERNYEPSGDVRIPVLSLHTLWDPATPVFHEAMYAETVAAAGRSQNLVQRIYPVYDHCTVPDTAVIDDFDSLVLWATTGTPPAPLNPPQP